MGLLDGKVAVVTGSGRGIGKAIALKLAKEGASVVINDLDAAPAEETVNEINSMGVKAVAAVGSVTDKEFPDKLIGAAVNDLGGLDIIVNNAGYTWDAVIQKSTDEMWEAMLAVHATAPFRIMRAAAPYIRENAKKEKAEGKKVIRKIVNVTSIAGVYGNAGQINYSAGKAAIIGMTKTMGKEWGRYNVSVNAVAYGIIETRLTAPKEESEDIKVHGKDIAVGIPKTALDGFKQMIPLGRLGTLEEAAGAVLFFASPLSDYVTTETLVCSGGLRF